MAKISLVRIDSRLIHGQVITKWRKIHKVTNQYKDGEVMLLFKDIKTCLELYKQGVPMEYVQLGGLPKASDKKVILRAVSLGEEDISLLREFDQSGVEVAVHIVPEEVKMPFAEIEKKYRES